MTCGQHAASRCARCGAPRPPDAPGGMCPKCLLARGLGGDDAGQPASGPEAAAPSVDALQKLFPQLEILEFVGRGGMGAVYKARQRRLNRVVALKILPVNAEAHPEAGERFLREAQALARLNHPNIVTIHDFGEAGEVCFFVMEFVEGEDLRRRLASGAIPPDQAVSIAVAICDALQYAHDRGVVHRDIKPANILLDASGRVRVGDFGLARVLGPGAEALALTLSSERMGTPYYMAPEQRESFCDADHRADIYALGVVFYEMLTGELPIGSFDPPSRKSGVSGQFDDLVMRALKSDPALRFQHADEFRAALEKLAGAGPIAGPPGRVRTVCAARAVPVLAAAGIVLGLALAGLWILFRRMPSVPQDVVVFGDSAYRVYYENVSWDRARRRCAELGGHLAVVDSKAEDEFLASISRSHVWLGATDEETEGEWLWLDGSRLTYSNWDAGEPNNAAGPEAPEGEDYLMLSRYAKWNDLGQSFRSIDGYICEWDKGTHPPSRRIASAGDAHDALNAANPGYRGQGSFAFSNGVMRSAVLIHSGVTDLSPLKGLPLESLDLSWNGVADLSPLEGMPLVSLRLARTEVEDLSPLAGMLLLDLRMEGAKVRDLAPLRGMPLRYLDISHTRVADLNALVGMPLEELHMNCSKVTDLSPVGGLPLKHIGLLDVPVSDLSPLGECRALETVVVPRGGRHIECLRALPHLQRLNHLVPADFWRDFDGSAP